MKLINAELVLEIEIKEGKPSVLVIENPWIMAKIVESLYESCCGQDSDFILSEDNKELNMEKEMEIIINPFTIDFNSRRIQNKLYGELLEAEGLYTEEKAILQGLIISYIDKLVQSVPYEMITHNYDVDLVKLLKMYEVRLEPQCNTLLERLTEYVKVLSRLMKKKLLILVNLCSYLNMHEIEELETICTYHKIYILYIDSYEQKRLFPVRTYIIDKDKCLIQK